MVHGEAMILPLATLSSPFLTRCHNQQRRGRNNSNNPELWWHSCLLLANWPFETHNRTHISLATNFPFSSFYICVLASEMVSLQVSQKKEEIKLHQYRELKGRR